MMLSTYITVNLTTSSVCLIITKTKFTFEDDDDIAEDEHLEFVISSSSRSFVGNTQMMKNGMALIKIGN